MRRVHAGWFEFVPMVVMLLLWGAVAVGVLASFVPREVAPGAPLARPRPAPAWLVTAGRCSTQAELQRSPQ